METELAAEEAATEEEADEAPAELVAAEVAVEDEVEDAVAELEADAGTLELDAAEAAAGVLLPPPPPQAVSIEASKIHPHNRISDVCFAGYFRSRLRMIVPLYRSSGGGDALTLLYGKRQSIDLAPAIREATREQ